MEQYQKALRMGACVIACAVALRLVGSGFVEPLFEVLAEPNIQSFLIYLETGRNVRFLPSVAENSEPVEETQTSAPAPALPHFGAEDASLVTVKSTVDVQADIEALLSAPLSWSLRDDAPTVLILHTHASESYTCTAGEVYEESSDYRTLDEAYNMISIGAQVAQILEENGIHVIHDRALHDYPSYNGSYADARTSTQDILARYPSIQLVLDLHRDASGDAGNQLRTLATVDGAESAQLLFVMGTDHDAWQENLALALKLHAQLERDAAGIMRPISLRSNRFNEDLSAGALLVEIGAAGNTHAEALRAATYLAQAIVALADGTE